MRRSIKASLEDEENAAELQFGSEGSFEGDNAGCLTNDEVYYLLKRNKHSNVGGTWNQTSELALAYVEKLSTTKIEQDLETLCTELTSSLKELELERRSDRNLTTLHPFEVASLANLVSSDSTSIEEALNWIPSLARFNEDDVMKAVNLVVETKQKIVESSLS